MSKGLNILINTSGSYEQLDTFKDENITIKENVKDFRDIKKVLTSLSKSFTIPASKRNNRILGHYYRGDLFNVDSRALIDAKLTLNDADYKFGNVSLEDTKFKDNEPHSYTIRFYGNLTELNKKIGEDELTDLDTSAHNIQNPNFFNEFKDSTATKKSVVFPVMSKNRRFISHSTDYDYAETEGFSGVANITYSTSSRADGYYGIIEQDLIGAIWTGSILDAIEDKYGVNFTGVLKDADYIRELRLLLQQKGSDGLSKTTVKRLVDNFTPSYTGTQFSTDTNGFTTGEVYEYINFYTEKRGEITFQVTTTASDFKLHLKRNGEVIETVDNTSSYTIRLDDSSFNNSAFTFEFEASGVASFSISATVSQRSQSKTSITVIDSQTISGSSTFTGSESSDYVVRENLPTMKVIDFLSDIFKRFNIVATVDGNLNIDTQHFDYYINKGNTLDISKYVDISSHKIGRPNFHSGIRFTTEKVETVGEYGFQKVNGRKYGELKYDINVGDSKLDGEIYKVDLKSKMIPLDDPQNIAGTTTAIPQSLILVDAKGEENQIAPTFIYTYTFNNRNIAFDTGSTVSRVNDYVYMPAEVYFINEAKDGFFQSEFIVGNYFSAEVSVFTSPTYNFADANLFNAFYRNTISIAFGESSRRAEYTAYLPIRFLHTLSTADIIVIANKKHIIESYSTNFLTGKTSFKLIQIDEATSDLFTTKSVNIVDGSSSKSSCFISADTGEATHIFTDNSTTHNVVGGESGIYRVQE